MEGRAVTAASALCLLLLSGLWLRERVRRVDAECKARTAADLAWQWQQEAIRIQAELAVTLRELDP